LRISDVAAVVDVMSVHPTSENRTVSQDAGSAAWAALKNVWAANKAPRKMEGLS